MKQITLIKEWNEVRDSVRENSIGFVPTMGALHEGHLRLVREAKRVNSVVVVSIFVNPTQFNSEEDFHGYPSQLEIDLALLEKEGVDFVFLPSFQELYLDHYRYKVSECDLSHKLCGAHRPGHFDGVLTVVMKLFNIIRPQRAYFGEKDYQQLLLIKGMVEAFFLPIEIVAIPTVREKDGLAMSSRNLRFSKEQREKAPLFAEILSNWDLTPKEVQHQLEEKEFVVDYIEEHFNRRFGAVKLGNIRLIDNKEIHV